MNRWAARHEAKLAEPLDGEEVILAAARVARARTRFGPRSDLPTPGRIFAIVVTDRRIALWQVTRWLGLPERMVTAVPLDGIATMTTLHTVKGSRLRLALVSGPMVTVEPVWGGSIRSLSQAFQALRPPR